MTLRWLVVGFWLSACSFRSQVPAAATISCAHDGECPKGLRCQPGTHTCVLSALLDDVPPAIARAETTLVPTFGNPLAKPTALGLNAALELRLTATEPLAATPLVTVIIDGVTSSSVTCSGQQTSATTSEHRCSVAVINELETQASLVATLTDLAKNEATITLTPPFDIDTRRPTPPEARGALLVSTSPWGDAETGFRPASRVLSSRPLPGVRQLLFRKRGVQLGTATLDDAGSFAPVELLRADDQLPLEAAAVDAAGNVSDFVMLGDEVWLATFKGKVANLTFPNPHRLQVTRALGLAIEGFPFEERGERDGIVTDGGGMLELQGAGTWLNLQLKGAPRGAGLASVGLDPLRSRIISFGGIGVLNGALTVNAETWEWNGRDWRARRPIDPESDGNPEGRVAAASTWDPSRRAFVIAAGMSNEPLNDVWAWNGTSWKRLPDLPLAGRAADGGVRGRIGSLLYWDTRLGRLVFTGGVDRMGSSARLQETFSLDDRTWVPMAPLPFGGRVGAAIATDPQTGITALVGGGDLGETDVWVQRNGEWQAFDAGPGPRARSFAAATAFPIEGTLVLHGGLANDGSTLDDLWVLSSAGWRQLDAGVGPGARSGHAFIFDPTRGTSLLFGRTPSLPPRPNDTWAFNGSQWERLGLQLEPPDTVLSNELLWLPPDGPVYALTESAGQVEVGLLSFEGWLHAPTTQTLPRSDVHLARVPPAGGVVVGGDGPGQLARVHFTFDDAGWSAGQTLQMSAESVQGLAVRANTLELLHCCGDAGTLMLSRRLLRLDGGLQATPVTPPMTRGALVALDDDSSSAVLGRPSNNGINTLSFINAGGTVTSSWPMPVSLAQPRLVALPQRNSLVMPGGQSFTGTTTDAWEFRIDAGWQVLPLADPEGDGQPLFGENMALGSDGKVVMAIDRDHLDDGVWVLDLKEQRPSAIVRFSLDQLPPDAVIAEATLEVRCGGEGGEGSDGGVGVVGAVRSFGVWVNPTRLTRTSAANPEWASLRVPREAAETLRRRDGELDFLLGPEGRNERTFAKLTIDAVQLRVRLER